MGVLTLRARLLIALAYVLVLAIGSMLVPLVRSVSDRIEAEVKQQSLTQADYVAASVTQRAELDELVATSARRVRGRVVIVDRDGIVLADSSPGTVGADFSNRPEIAAALRGDVEQVERESETLDQQILATAVPVVRNGRRDGAVRITQSVDAVAARGVVGDDRARARGPDRARPGSGGGSTARGEHRAAAAPAGECGPARR